MQHLTPELSVEEFLSSLHTSKPVFVDFYADWCEPCKILDQILDEIVPHLDQNMVFVKADIDEQKALSQHFQIKSVPTLMVFQNGNMLWRMPGFMTAPEMIVHLRRFINKS